MADSGSDARGRGHRGTGSHTWPPRNLAAPEPGRPGTVPLLSATLLSVPPRERAAQRSAARIAASMPGNANEKPESSSCPGITR